MLEPCTIIVFGATGDLATKKLIPALVLLQKAKRLDAATRIIAVGRKELKTKALLDLYRKELPKDVQNAVLWKEFTRKVEYHHIDFQDPSGYDVLAKACAPLPPNRLFYLATPQDVFNNVITHLSRTGLASRTPQRGWHRVVFEKPFGSDLRSARMLNNEVSRLFDEQQVYRIDHYIAKTFVNEIFSLRFANPLFENQWNRKFIEQVEIVISESDGIGQRAGYYENAGAIRDMFQNHLLQLLSLIAMEPPTTLDAHAIRKRKADLLQDVHIPWSFKHDIVSGQYAEGIMDGKRVVAYTKEDGVPAVSRTETFVAMRLGIRNARWLGVPFILMTGKRLKERYAEIRIRFRPGNWIRIPDAKGQIHEDLFTIRIQPEEGLRFLVNLSDESDNCTATPKLLDFTRPTPAGINTAGAYRFLLEQAIEGDQTLFTSWEFLEQAWRITDKVRAHAAAPEPYPSGSGGPTQAMRFFSHHH